MKTIVITRNYIDGFHCYPDAPLEVGFLRNLHRHIFHIECGFAVDHDNREKEIFIYQSKIEKYIYDVFGKPAEFKNLSCEAIAENIMQEFDCNYVKVTEDGEGGAIIQR